jgi:hypothetical protein
LGRRAPKVAFCKGIKSLNRDREQKIQIAKESGIYIGLIFCREIFRFISAMKIFFQVLTICFLISCGESKHVSDEKERSVTSSAERDGASLIGSTTSRRKLSVFVLPPFDKIANEGISPNIQKYLEMEIAKDTSLTVIKFPYRDLMNIPYYNVFDKKYCKPIAEKIETDIIVMTKLEQEERTGQMGSDKWNLLIRIYDVAADEQTNSEVTGVNLTDAEIAYLIKERQLDLVSEITGNP